MACHEEDAAEIAPALAALARTFTAENTHYARWLLPFLSRCTQEPMLSLMAFDAMGRKLQALAAAEPALSNEHREALDAYCATMETVCARAGIVRVVDPNMTVPEGAERLVVRLSRVESQPE